MPTRPITINLPVKLFNRLADLSSKRDTPRETLVRVWVGDAIKRAWEVEGEREAESVHSDAESVHEEQESNYQQIVGEGLRGHAR